MLCTSALANSHVYQIKVESHPNSSITHDIELAFGQLLQKLRVEKTQEAHNYKQFANTIEEYEYIQKNKTLWLHIKFNKKLTLRYLDQNSLTQLLPNTSDTLLLVAKQDATGKSLLDFETSGFLLDEIIQEAAQIGLNIITPNMDITDLDLMTFEDIWHQNITPLKKIAKRYHTKNLLIVQLQQNEQKQWHSSWQLFQDNKIYKSTSEGTSIKVMAKQTIDQLHIQMRNPQRSQYLHLQIFLQNPQDSYQEMLFFIKKIPGVQNVQLDGVTQGSVFYTLNSINDEDSLIKSIKTNKNITNIRVL